MVADEKAFAGQVVLITGGGRGLGRSVAEKLSDFGAKLILADNGTALNGGQADSALAQQVACEIDPSGQTVRGCAVDLATEAGAQSAVKACLDEFGRIDAIAHFASPSPDPKTADALSTSDLDLVMRVNAYAGAWLAREAWPHMQKQGHGRILYAPSAALYGSFGGTDYAMAKAAYIGLIRCLALEGADANIHVNGISPAAQTRMTDRFPDSPYARWFAETMRPEQVAVGAAWMLSRGCSINGEILAIGGGRIGRITISESEGLLGLDDSLAAIDRAMPAIMDDQRFFQSPDLSDRSQRVAALFGFDGSMNSNTSFAVEADEGEQTS